MLLLSLEIESGFGVRHSYAHILKESVNNLQRSYLHMAGDYISVITDFLLFLLCLQLLIILIEWDDTAKKRILADQSAAII